MVKTYRCPNPDHPENVSRLYNQMTRDGWCPECGYGVAALEEFDVEEEKNIPEHSGKIGLCILVFDASGTMTERAFPGNPARKIDLVAGAAASGITDLYGISIPNDAYIAIIAFGANALVLPDPTGKPFLKSIADIKKAFPTKEGLGQFLSKALSSEDNVDYRYTDITDALSLAKEIEDSARNGDFEQYGLPGTFKLIEHDIVTFNDEMLPIPNTRTLIYSDGKHNPADGRQLYNPYETKKVSMLMTAYFGQGDEEGAKQMESLACTCPVHGIKGYFLIDNPKQYTTLRHLFRMSSGVSGFCPACLKEKQEEMTAQETK